MNTKLKLRWARSYDFNKFTQESYKEWQDSIHEKELTLADELAAGTWNKVTVDLVPCAANETGFLEISLKTPTVSLRYK